MNENITKESLGDLVIFHGGRDNYNTWTIDEMVPGDDETKFTMSCDDYPVVHYTYTRHGFGDSAHVIRKLLRKAIIDELANGS